MDRRGAVESVVVAVAWVHDDGCRCAFRYCLCVREGECGWTRMQNG